MCPRQSRKVISDMINTVFPDAVAFKPTFVAFLQHSRTYVHGLSCHSFKFLWRRVNSKPHTILFGIVAFTFGTTFREIAVNNISSFFHYACIVDRVIKPLESYESTQIKSQNDRPSHEIPHESRANLRVPARVCEVEVAQYVLKIAHLAISMEPRGPRACDLLLRLWLLVQTIHCVPKQIISTAVVDRLVRITRRFQMTQEAWKNDSRKVSGQRGS